MKTKSKKFKLIKKDRELLDTLVKEHLSTLFFQTDIRDAKTEIIQEITIRNIKHILNTLHHVADVDVSCTDTDAWMYLWERLESEVKKRV